MKTLKDVEIGSRAVVVRLHGEGAVRRRILDMGLVKGTEVVVRKVAPIGDPIELTVRGYELSIRRDEAAEAACRECRAMLLANRSEIKLLIRRQQLAAWLIILSLRVHRSVYRIYRNRS